MLRTTLSARNRFPPSLIYMMNPPILKLNFQSSTMAFYFDYPCPHFKNLKTPPSHIIPPPRKLRIAEYYLEFYGKILSEILQLLQSTNILTNKEFDLIKVNSTTLRPSVPYNYGRVNRNSRKR